MKRLLKIIKGLGLILLLFTLVSSIGVSDSSYEASAKIVQASTEDGKEATTIMNTYTKDCDDTTGIHVTAEISGSGEKTITDEDGVIPTEEDTAPVEDETTSITTPPKFESGESLEEFDTEVEAWVQYILEEALLKIDDFPADIAI